jgi:hypothetical protein
VNPGLPRTSLGAFGILAILLPLAAGAWVPALRPDAPFLDSIHAYVGKGDFRTADSLARAHAEDTLATDPRDRYAVAAFRFLAGNLDSVLSMLPDDRYSVHPVFPHDPDLGRVLGYAKEEIDRRIDSAYGGIEAAAALKLLREAMTDFANEDRKDSLYDPDWFYGWKPSPARRKLNGKVLEHLSRYGNGPYGRALSEKIYFLIEKYRTPLGLNLLEGGGWMDGRDAGPIWWRSTSYAYEYPFKNGFAYLKLGRALGGFGIGYSLLGTQRLALSPYAGIAEYPFVALGEYANTRRYAGPDLGLNFDWIFRTWKPPRALLNLYLRSNAGIVLDPGNLSADFHRTSFVYLNFGLGFRLDAFALYTPYVRDGKVKLHREWNW